jgi:hypothetical protein
MSKLFCFRGLKLMTLLTTYFSATKRLPELKEDIQTRRNVRKSTRARFGLVSTKSRNKHLKMLLLSLTFTGKKNKERKL